MKRYRAYFTDPTRQPEAGGQKELKDNDLVRIHAWAKEQLAAGGLGSYVGIYEMREQLIDIQRKQGDLVRAGSVLKHDGAS